MPRIGVVVALLSLLSLTLSGAFASAKPVEIEITQCSAENPEECDQSTTTVRPDPKPQPKPSRPTRRDEVHTVDLRNGKSRVEGRDGKDEEESVDVDVSPSVQDQLDEDRKDRPAPKRPDTATGGRTVKPPVSTSGGGGLPGAFGAALASVSSDQALAQFSIPPFLMPIYIAAGRAYGIPWNVLASINQIETNFGRNLNVSSAGAQGWMQFMPATWDGYGVDASGDGWADPYNPVDAIYAAARYLRASGGAADLRRAVFAYNHADWYVDQVLKTAGIYGSLPQGLVGETSTLAYGRFPLLGEASYGDDFREAEVAGRQPDGISIEGHGGATAIATQDVTVDRVLLAPELAAELKQQGKLARLGEAPAATVSKPPAARTAAEGIALAAAESAAAFMRKPAPVAARTASAPVRPSKGGLPAGYGISSGDGITVIVRDAAGDRYGYSGLAKVPGTVRPGAQLDGGAPVGTLSEGPRAEMLFTVTSASGVRVDPRPLVDGYRLQEATELSHAVSRLGRNPFLPAASAAAEGGDPFSIPSGGGAMPSQDSVGGLKPGIRKVARAVLSRFKGLVITSTTGGNHVSGSWHYSGHAVDIAGPVPVMRRAAQWIVRSGLYRSIVEGIFNPDMAINNGQLVPSSFYSGTWAGHADHLHIAVSDGGLRTPGADPFGAALPARLGGGGRPPKASAAEQRKLSRRLYKIANPQVARKRSAVAQRVSRERPELPKPTSALAVDPTALGARVRDIAIPAAGGPERAWAVGTVDGSAREGWAKSQVVLLAHRAGGWEVVGPPRDAQGKVVNPQLRALAVARGRGYAVGDRGSVVAFGKGTPRLLATQAKASLRAVAVDAAGTSGVAVGDAGTVLRLTGARAAATAVSNKPKLTDVSIDGGAALITAAGASGGSPLYRLEGGAAKPAKADFGLPEDTAVELESVAEQAGELWVAGSIADAGGTGGPRPFAARRSGSGWQSFCSDGPAPAGVAELGQATPSACHAALAEGLAGGTATALGVTRDGAVVAMPEGLEVFDGKSFRSVRRVPKPDMGNPAVVSRLAVDAAGEGWAVRGNGAVDRIAPAGAQGRTGLPTSRSVQLPDAGAATSATVAVSLDGDRALTFSGGSVAEVADGAARRVDGPGVPVRSAALTGGDAVAITDSGHLIVRRDGAWSRISDDGRRGASLAELLLARRTLGTSTPLEGAVQAEGDSPLGFEALAFRSSDDGYAVGRAGAIAHYDGSRWTLERGPAVDLRSVAAGPGGVVAVGSDGTLVERDGDDWKVAENAAELAKGQDVTAAAALSDGSMLAAAGGSLLERPEEGSWRAAEIAPLGMAVEKLAGYRDEDDRPHALALVRDAAGVTLLDGDADGWDAVPTPAGLSLTDFGVDRNGERLWLSGIQGSGAATATLALPLDPQSSGPSESRAGVVRRPASRR